MTTSLTISTVTNAVESLSITGVTILDVDEIPDTIGLDVNVLAPLPNGFISNMKFTRADLTGQNQTVEYDLRYRFYLCAFSTAGLLSNYSSLVSYAQSILFAFASDATLSGAIDNGWPVIENMGPVSDPAGKGFHGFDVVLHVMQFVEV